MQTPLLFQSFKTNISGITLPEKFTFPFYYQPHELSLIAAQELQEYLENQTDFEHNFGLKEGQEGLIIGKMFGVLVCQNQHGAIGYLWAFSGKLAGVNHLPYFVPTVFDMLDEHGFFRKEEDVISAITEKIESLEQAPEFLACQQKFERETALAATCIAEQKEKIQSQKQIRNVQRATFDRVNQPLLYHIMEVSWSNESIKEKVLLKNMTKYFDYRLQELKGKYDQYIQEINDLKELRKQKSAALQKLLFAEYAFFNVEGKTKSLGEIFDDNPPAGAGECAAPKLLHYAFEHKLKPIAMAEFWWGQSPKSEVRKHKQFYPACRRKCEPILMGHMLHGLNMDENPLIENHAQGRDIEIVYEDEVIVVINKPVEFLSVPGKTIADSVYHRIKEIYPEATGPIIVHRLDMSTSGIMLIAKDEPTYVKLQSQFINRTIKKRYLALLDGIVKQPTGFIDLPLRVDLNDRPRQLVCYEHGKPAQTHFEVLSIKNKQTRIHFYPITGRTHQLRMHASHELGLNAPIVGDDLYGTKANRLHLHAEWIQFHHPVSGELMEILVEAEF